ncbi:MAG: cysteine peptidase family C39 domain-containing protein [Bacteroidales bacterium]|nr:cysteine peptidase family C39 domain-containing protein [Bacteroidales bacterium]
MLLLRQRDAMDCGPACLAMVAGHWISTKTNGEEKGIALLLEPTDGFRIGENGGKGYRTSV